MLKISRFAEDLIIYSSLEFGFIHLADAYSTGSSLMPQKKNADSLELLRGKSGRAIGQMTGLMCTIKGLPTTYAKDLQESVEPLLDHVKTVGDSIQILTGVLSTLTTHPEKMVAALSPEMLATEIADYLVGLSGSLPEYSCTSSRDIFHRLGKGFRFGKDTMSAAAWSRWGNTTVCQ